jgi:PAS domain S-box-containing protein
MKKRILVVEDEFITAADIVHHLEETGYEVPATADTGDAAIQKTAELRPDLILMDITLIGEMTGIEAAGKILELYGIPVVFLTAHSEESTVEKALASNPFGYVIKPFDPSNLRVSIEMALFKHAMEERLRESERTIRSLLDAIPDALLLIDDERRIVAFNENMGRRMGEAPGRFTGVPVTDLIAAGALDIPPGEIETMYKTSLPSLTEVQKDGRWLEVAIHPLKDERGDIGRVAIQFHDVTDQRALEEEMKKEGISQIERNMEQFQILNDQIRNPLQVIRGCMELGGDPALRRRVEEQVEIIDDLVDRLDRGWVESEKVHSFLIRHCQIGIAPPARTDGGGIPDR